MHGIYYEMEMEELEWLPSCRLGGDGVEYERKGKCKGKNNN